MQHPQRILKILFSALVAIYTGLVCFNNIFDYSSNFEFVRHVASMDDTFSKAHNGWRALQNPVLHHLLYWIIILTEISITSLLAYGAVQMARTRPDAAAFGRAKQWTTWGFALGVMLWFFVFISVGGEWFLMWQSKTWNAQGNAFSLTGCFLLFLIFHQQDEG
jgi:predicted small integral membrane protein